MKLALLFILAISLTDASRILFLFPSPSKSHLIVVKGLSTTLAERGHDVTVVSPFPLEKPMKNYRDINVGIPQDMHDLTESMIKTPKQAFFLNFPRLISNLFIMGNDMLQSKEFRKVMEEESFDLVIIGMFFNNYLLGVGDHFKCPTMMLSVSGAMTFTNDLTGNPLGAAAVRNVFTGLEPTTFKNRLINFIAYGGDYLMLAYVNYMQKKNYEINFPQDRYISYDDSQKNLSMILVNGHFSQGEVRPMVPAMVEVGGIQIKPIPDKLPERIQSWLNGASEHGAIFFSLGSNAKTNFLSHEKIKSLLEVFSKLKQRVIMKWESDELEGKPDNVLIGKWLPQDDILAHKNIKVFISHCGLGSVAEAKYHGVPVLAMPIAIDQFSNAESLVADGLAERVNYADFNQLEIEKALRKLLDDPKYYSKAKTFSNLYRDRPQNARETGVYWVEYVIRHRGAPHLRYPAADMNFWQRNSVDVVGFLIAVIIISFKVFIAVVKLMFSFASKSGKAKNKKVKKQ